MAKQTVAEIVTNKMIEALEAGTVPWHKPWVAGFPTSISTKKAYRGINLFILSMSEYTSKWWGTSKQITKLGGRVKYEEFKNGTPIHFWQFIEDKEDETKKFPMHRFYTVYNLDQCEDFPPEVLEKFATSKNINTEDIDVEAIFKNMQCPPEESVSASRASYSPQFDLVSLPDISSFDSSDAYYSTKFHEYVHSTGAAKRLNRKGIVEDIHFGSERYSKEELVAEAGATILCATVGIESTFDNSAAYVANWLEQLKDDRKLLISAFGQAQKAVDYILGTEFKSKKV